MLGLFARLFLGVVLLLAFWLVAVLVFAGLVGRLFDWWVLLGIPVAAVLLLAGLWLLMDYVTAMEPGDDGLVGRLFTISVFVAVVAGGVAGITAGMAGPQLYHEAHGSTTSAVVTYIGVVNGENGGVTGHLYHVDDQRTGDDLGWLAQVPRDDTAEGDVIEVSVDPRGWLPPVPVDSMGGTRVPAVVLVCCLGVVGFAAFSIVVAGLGRCVVEASRRR